MDRDVLRRPLLVVCMLALAVVAFAACGQTPTATPAVMATPVAADAFIPGYVIATGNPAVIAEAVTAFNKEPEPQFKGMRLEDVETLALPNVSSCQAVTVCLRTGAEMRLYHLTGADTQPVESTDKTAAVITWLNNNYRDNKKCLYVDAVHRTGAPPPNLVGGDPWIAGGSPWIAGGSGGGVAVAATNTGFQTQWALGGRVGNSRGISLTAANGARLPTHSGKGVRVGVFDTSPFAASTPITWVAPVFTVNVMTVPGAAGPATTSAPQPNMRDHGLFVAGLVHAVAPNSEIRLYPVLDDNAAGDLWTLARAIHHFVNSMVVDRGNLHGAVMNLSLGLHPQAGSAGGPTKDVMALATLVSAAHCQGIVVVAAAGNDSAGRAAQPAQLPASLPEALAVAASDMAGNRACYSNRGEIMAPGGEATDGCTGQFGPPSVISLVAPSQDAHDGYAYWAGTSFATPMVSGLAALVAERQFGVNPGLWAQQPMTFSASIAAAILAGAATSPDTNSGMKIINVHGTVQ